MQKPFEMGNITSNCLFCMEPKWLLYVVAGFKTYLNEGCCTPQHDSVLNFIALALKVSAQAKFHVEENGFIHY